MQVNPLSLILMFFGVLWIYLTAYAWRRRSTVGVIPFTGILATASIYTLAYSMELSSLDIQSMLFWSKIEYLGNITLPAFWLVFVFQYSRREKWVTRRTLFFIFLIPVITILLKFNDDFLHLIYRTTWVDTSGPIALLSFTRGPWYWVDVAYTVLAILAGIILLWLNLANQPLLYRQQMTIMTISASVPLLVYILYAMGLQPVPSLKELDLNPFSFIILSLGVFWVMFRYQLVDLMPVAREVLIENLNDGVVVLDVQNRVVDVNPAAQMMFGWESIPVGQPIQNIWSNWQFLRSKCEGRDTKISDIQHTHSGEMIFFDADFSDLRTKKGQKIGRLIVLHDVTARKNIEDELKHAKEAAEAAYIELRNAWVEMEKIAATDKLTGVFNRRKFEEIALSEISRAERYGSPLSIVMLDIDHFKQVNDCYGHHTGDEVLIELARLISENKRMNDSLIRWGGEEFIMMTPGIYIQQAIQLAEKIRSLVDNHNFPTVEKITISLGVTQYQSPDTIDSLIRRADNALYCAKKNGRNRVEAE